MTALPASLTITDLSTRSGVPASALRFYESRGLIASERTEGNHRRYPRAVLRRVALIRAAQTVGLSLEEIRTALETLPPHATPGPSDWERLSAGWRDLLDARIDLLRRLREDLTGCIGCGCLSLERCSLFNREDRAATKGPGARYLAGDIPEVD